MAPTLPPMALACPRPLADVLNHGIHALPDKIAAHNAINQPGRERVM